MAFKSPSNPATSSKSTKGVSAAGPSTSNNLQANGGPARRLSPPSQWGYVPHSFLSPVDSQQVDVDSSAHPILQLPRVNPMPLFDDYDFLGPQLALPALDFIAEYQANRSLRDSMYGSPLNNLTNALHQIFGRTLSVEELVKMMRFSRRDSAAISNPFHYRGLFLILWVAVEKFKIMGSWRDLEDGIGVAELNLSSVEPSSDFYPQIRESTGQLYQMKFEHTGDVADLKKAVHHSEQGILSMEFINPELGPFLHQHLSRLLMYSNLLEDVPEVERLINSVGRFVSYIQGKPSNRFDNTIPCARLYGELISRLYFLSCRPADLLKALTQVRTLLAILPDSSTREHIERGIKKVTRLVEAPQSDPITTQVSRALHAAYCKRSKTGGLGAFLHGLVHVSVLEAIVVRVQISDPNTLQLLPEDIILARTELAKSLGVKGITVGSLVPVTREDLDDPEHFEAVISNYQKGYLRICNKLDQMGLSDPNTLQVYKDNIKNIGGSVREFYRDQEKIETDLDALKQKASSLTSRLRTESCSLAEKLLTSEELAIVLANIQNQNGDLDGLNRVIEVFESGVKLADELYKQCERGEYFGGENISMEKLAQKRVWMIRQLSTAHSARFLQTRSTADIDRYEELSQRLLEEVGSSPDAGGDAGSKKTGTKVPRKLVESEDAHRPNPDKVYAQAARARSLRFKYKFHNGTLEDLDVALPLLENALRDARRIVKFPKDELAEMANDWGLLMRARFRELGELDDLDAGIEVMAAILEDEGLGIDNKINSRLRVSFLTNLSILYSDKYDRTKAQDCLQISTRYRQEAIDSSDHVSVGLRADLASLWLESYFLTNEVGDLEQALTLARQDVEAASAEPANTDISIAMSNAGSVFLAAFNHWKDVAYLNQAYRYAKRAVDFPPGQRAAYPDILLEFSKAAEAQHNYEPTEASYERCLRAYMAAWRSEGPGASPLIRVTAARGTLRLLIREKRLQECEEVLRAVMKFLQTACPRWMAAGDRHHCVSLFSGIPADTAAICLQNRVPGSSPIEILRLLEQGRGVILGSTIEYRSAKQRLQSFSAEVYRDYNELCLQMDALVSEAPVDRNVSAYRRLVKELGGVVKAIRQLPAFALFSPPIHAGSAAASRLSLASPSLYRQYTETQQMLDGISIAGSGRKDRKRREISIKMDEILAAVRTEPGMEDLLLPPDERSMRVLAREGPIAVITSSSLFGRSDAILIQASGIEVLPLPILTLEALESWTAEMLSMTTGWSPRNFAAKNRKMRDYLLWLWKTAVRPVLVRLGIKPTASVVGKTRMHWVGVGPLSWTPFHAAGDHSPGSLENTMSYVISSYSPTIRSLAYARDQATFDSGKLSKSSRMLLVTAPDTPGMTKLTGIREEIDAITSTCGSSLTVLHLEDPAVEDVTRQLPLANIAHFACHGVSDPLDPDNSHLVLQSSNRNNAESDETTLAVRRYLSVRNISACRSPNAELAYLSACSAAENHSAGLADEAIYIASAFHLAGFRHVVATLWLAKDDVCPQVAGAFYASLLRNKNAGDRTLFENKETLTVAQALHEAVDELRVTRWKRPLEWVPFVHIGP